MKFQLKWAAGCTAAAVVALLWPGPSVSADQSTSLGGYQAIAEAAAVHVEVYEPTIPIPASPQGDISIGYTKSNVDTGPTTRALASYLWPGVVIGDGFDQLLMIPGTHYPVQANSRFPATTTAPATNAVQLTDGNGMSTSTDGFHTTAGVTSLGIIGPGTNLISGIGSGLNQLDPSGKTKAVPTLPSALPVSGGLAALVSAKNVTSDSTVTVADKTVTSDAHAAVSNLSLLSGLIQIKGLDVESKVVSDGAKATTSGDATIGSLSIGGIPIALSAKGNDLSLPALSKTLSGLLTQLGLSLSIVPVTESVTGAQGSMTAQALQITVDTAPMKKIVDNVLNPLLSRFPDNVTTQLAPVLGIAPKFVITVGSANATATASPAFTGDGGGSFTGGGTGSTGGSGSDSTDVGGNTTPLLPPSSNPQTSTPNAETTAPMQPTSSARALPGLGSVPRMLVLGAIVLAALIGWLITSAAGFLLGGAANCDYGLSTGVPDLRKG